PFIALARRMVPASPLAVALAVLALALAPSHLQASTTAASEALYLLLLVAALERLHAAVTGRRRAQFLVAGLLASLAAVTRFDSWLAMPAAAGAIVLFGGGGAAGG